MGTTNIYSDRKKKFVVIENPQNTATKLCYCFATPVDDTEVTILGQTTITPETTFPHPAITGTQNIYPARMTNPVTGISSLCSTSAVSAARQAGWSRAGRATFQQSRVQDTNVGGFTSSTRGSVIVVVDCESDGGKIKFGWRIQKKQLSKIGQADMTALGISFPSSDAEWAEVVLGSDLPRPARATKTVIDGATGKTDTISTFYGSGVTTLPDGWIHSEDVIPFSNYYA